MCPPPSGPGRPRPPPPGAPARRRPHPRPCSAPRACRAALPSLALLLAVLALSCLPARASPPRYGLPDRRVLFARSCGACPPEFGFCDQSLPAPPMRVACVAHSPSPPTSLFSECRPGACCGGGGTDVGYTRTEKECRAACAADRLCAVYEWHGVWGTCTLHEEGSCAGSYAAKDFLIGAREGAACPVFGKNCA